MKTKKKCLMLLSAIVVIVFLEVVIADSLACRNGPNYWGMGFPGNFSTEDYYKAPKKPSDFIFGKKGIDEDQFYDGSHYGTHDWIADAALRTLRNAIKNPLHFGDWTWLINSDIARNKWPSWKEDYGASSGFHRTIRSYYTFIFATQMPDMKKNDYPDIQKIDIPSEGVIIKDFEIPNMWVGQENKHRYHFKYIRSDTGIYNFIPVYTGSATTALLLGKEAIKCISNTKTDDNGNKISAMQPEGASGWLGSMTHYLADLVVPAHIIERNMHPHVYSKALFHNWFENYLANMTKWDKKLGSNGGPEQTIFSWDTYKVTLLPIIPIPPDIAVARMADEAIKIAFRTDGNHQHIPINGNNHAIAENSGLFINYSTYNTDIYWDWDDDLKSEGRLNSNHQYYYNKVEELLCWSVYYTACAMQYCYNEGKKENNDNAPNPNYFVDNPERDNPSEFPPVSDPQSHIDDFLNYRPPVDGENRIARNFKNIANFIASIALVGIPDAIRKVIEIASDGSVAR